MLGNRTAVRGVLSLPLALAAWWCEATLEPAASAAERPAVTQPRQTSGDKVVQPTGKERLTVTVGQNDSYIVGTDHRTIQAVDYVARLGGGSVRILAGTYRLRNASYLQSGVNLCGAGAESILIKEPAVTSPRDVVRSATCAERHQSPWLLELVRAKERFLW